MIKLSLCTITAVAALTVAAPATTAAIGKGAPAKAPATTSGQAKGTIKARPRPVPAAIKDCAADGDLDKVYAPGVLKRALKRLPADLGAYTDCPDVLRFAAAAGPVLPVNKRTARLRAKCTGASYGVTIAVGDRAIASATVPACRKGAKIVRITVTPSGAAKAGKRGLATIVATPGGKTLQFVVRLAGRRFQPRDV